MLRLLAFLLLASVPAHALGISGAAVEASSNQPITIGTQWFNAATANGGSPSTTRRDLNIGLIQSYQQDGSWFLMDDLWMLVAEDQPSALTSWKTRTLATVVNAPTFTIDRGYTFNGTTQYILTNLAVQKSAWNAAIPAFRMAVYERTNQISTGASAGHSSGNNTKMIKPRNTSTALLAFAESGQGTYTISAESRGYWVVSRAAGSTSLPAYYAGSLISTQTVTAGTTIDSTASFAIGARNDAGTINTFRSATEGLLEWGAQAFSSGQEGTHYTALQAYMTTLGANVP